MSPIARDAIYGVAESHVVPASATRVSHALALMGAGGWVIVRLGGYAYSALRTDELEQFEPDRLLADVGLAPCPAFDRGELETAAAWARIDESRQRRMVVLESGRPVGVMSRPSTRTGRVTDLLDDYMARGAPPAGDAGYIRGYRPVGGPPEPDTGDFRTGPGDDWGLEGVAEDAGGGPLGGTTRGRTRRGRGLTLAPAEDEPPPREVTTGFSSLDHPHEPLPGDRTLAAGGRYFFWFHIGEPQEGGVDRERTRVPDAVPLDADLDIVVFAVGSGLTVEPGANSGTFRLYRDRLPEVAVRPSPDGPGTAGRLYFPLRANQPGRHRLRCNMYYRQALVQSRLVEAEVTAEAEPRDGALATRLDFCLSGDLDPGWFAARSPHLVSLFVNDNGDGSHSFMFHGADRYSSAATIPEGAIEGNVAKARAALRKTTYGSDAEYDPDTVKLDDFKYRGRPPWPDLEKDLIRLALWGWRIYHAVVWKLARPEDGEELYQAVEKLQSLMRRPGLIQIVSKVSPSLYVPAAIMYDFPLDDGAPDHTLCPQFTQDRAAGADLADADCFQGRCPTYDDDTVVCPGGFWGYRHAVGQPVTPSEEGADTASGVTGVGHIRYPGGRPVVAMACATDLSNYDTHLGKLERTLDADFLPPATDRAAAMELLKTTKPHLVYLYCHGGKSGGEPFLRVGPSAAQGVITTSNARSFRWHETRPLVFINGCHTTSLGPEEANSFVEAFVTGPGAAGVVGTEVTIVEDLAISFAERFLVEYMTVPYDTATSIAIGEAVRRTRLALLANGSPLGLLYVPFISADVDMVPAPP